MPTIIDYALALAELENEGLRCNYHNSGSFRLLGDPAIRGWLGPADETILPHLRELTRFAPMPHERTLARWTEQAWQTVVPGALWLMPASHWAYELAHGNPTWLPGLLKSIGIDPGLLSGRTDASPLAFGSSEGARLSLAVESLLTQLRGSDFTLAFPERAIICTLHHHKQLWWATTERPLVELLDRIE